MIDRFSLTRREERRKFRNEQDLYILFDIPSRSYIFLISRQVVSFPARKAITIENGETNLRSASLP